MTPAGALVRLCRTRLRIHYFFSLTFSDLISVFAASGLMWKSLPRWMRCRIRAKSFQRLSIGAGGAGESGMGGAPLLDLRALGRIVMEKQLSAL